MPVSERYIFGLLDKRFEMDKYYPLYGQIANEVRNLEKKQKQGLILSRADANLRILKRGLFGA